MKLTCNDHTRRVVVLEQTTVHRSDGSLCDSKFLNMFRGQTLTPALIRLTVKIPAIKINKDPNRLHEDKYVINAY